jgi:cell division protein FtsQ
MARSRAAGPLTGRASLARASLARLARPLAAAPSTIGQLPAGRSRARAPRRSGNADSARARRVRRLIGLALRAISRRRRLRIALLCFIVSVPLLGGGFMWLRHSSFVAVRHVRVSGVHGAEAKAIEAALTGAARRMSTLDVNAHALRAAVAPFAVVREVHASASPPHGLSIHVTEQLPVAALFAGGTRTAVAANGVVLGQALLSSTLPSLSGSSVPAAGARVADQTLLAALAVLGAAPGPFAKVVARVYTSASGLTVAMRNGLLAYFGDATRPHAKWASLARVLADSSSAGSTYVDVRVPEHPAAGGFAAGSGPAASAAGASTPGTALGSGSSTSGAGSEGTIAAIAARLAGPAGSESASTGREGLSAPSESQSASAGTEAGSTTPAETTHAPSGESSESATAPTTKGP